MEVLSSETSPFKRRKVNPSCEDDVARVIVTSAERLPEKSPAVASVELRSTDLKEDSFIIEISKVIDSKLSGEISSEEPKQSPRQRRTPAASCGPKNTAAKVPPAEEIEEFFSAAEKQEQKRFLEKYNFDIVKDVPLEGHYQWIRLKP